MFITMPIFNFLDYQLLGKQSTTAADTALKIGSIIIANRKY
jgi:hypothetical protein